MKVTSISATNKFSTVTVSDEVFGAAVNKELLSQAIRVYLSNKRQGTSRVKTRSEVIGSRRKIWKQKGTGNARHGARSAPIFVGGGVTHGPTGVENWDRSLSKNMKRKALISALSSQAENIVVTASFDSIEGKTKQAAQFLKSINASDKKVLIMIDTDNEQVRRAFQNIPKITVMQGSLVNALDIARADQIVMTKSALKSLEERLTKKQVEATETK